MGNLRSLLLTGALALLIHNSAHAQSTLSPRPAVGFGTSNFLKTLVTQPEPTTVDPTTYLALRAGALVSPRVAGLIGIDATLPRFSIAPGWKGRLDVDVIISASLINTNTAVPVTINQIYYQPQTGKTDVYAGFGIGAIFGGDANFTGKLILGANFTSRFSGEVNVHFTDREKTLVLLLGRFRL
jgi:hypothetical protein